jgi:hypothetical protein
MKATQLISLLVALVFVTALAAQRKPESADDWRMHFDVSPADFSSTGRNPYFILEPGYTMFLVNNKERLTITVLKETRTIDNVETRVVEERESNNEQLVEVSRNYFAISKKDNSVYYFGEDVDIYKNGKVLSHEGSWQAGVNGARFGMMMPGTPTIRAKYYQEICPGIAMDRAEIMSVDEKRTTPGGTYKKVLKIAETSPLEPKTVEFKYYAPEVGLIQDGSLKLQGLIGFSFPISTSP